MRLQRVLIVIVVGITAAVTAIAGCGREKVEQRADSGESAPEAQQQYDTLSGATLEIRRTRASPSQPADMPRLVDLGKGTCIPCKKMAPILEDLKREYHGRATVEVIDLREDPEAAKEYGIRLIPTQIFFDGTGKEVWRHEGFLAKDAIIAKFTEMGVEPLDN